MTTTTTAPEAAAAPESGGLGQAWRDYTARVRGGELGALPSVLALITLVIIFTALKGTTFLSAANFANLITQSATIIVLAMGLIYVLLLGEIDLSAGFAAGTAAAVLAVTLTKQGLPLVVCLVATLITGVAIGLFNGVIVAKLGIPSFVVTLAMFLALQGLMLIIIGDGGTIPVRNDFIKAIMNSNLPPVAGWILYAVVVVGYILVTFRTMESRRKSGLVTQSRQVWLVKVIALAVLLGLAVFILNGERSRSALVSIQGVPYVVILIVALLVGLTYQLNRTSFGRHVYAVGGNAEAARRAGINVATIRIACFIACSTLAAVAGILFASKDQSVSPSTGGSTTLLYAVGAAVIGGTSLFGGRGKIRDAILGGLVVAVIGNGLPLITDASGIQFIVTGLVLLVAASVDALSRRRAQASGRA